MANDAYARLVEPHYAAGDLEGAILAGLRAAGKDLAALTPDDLAPVDQFHSGGKAATLALAALAGVRNDEAVLDVGGAVGGPARLLAATFGCRVTVLDVTAAYCRAGAALTARLGLTAQVTFVQGAAGALPFAGEAFDLVWMQHSSMNIAGKESLYSDIHRVLRPGGRLALHEIVAGPDAPIHFPVPWARDPALSFLRSAEATRGAIAAVGFRELVWQDGTLAALAWFQGRAAALAARPAPPLGVGLLVGPDFDLMLTTLIRNLAEGRVAVVQALFTR
jgi:SAM-dependent methyltransferase